MGQQVVVAVSARDAERGSGHEHARSDDFSGRDRIAQGDVAESFGTDVANRRKAGLKRDFRRRDTIQRCADR